MLIRNQLRQRAPHILANATFLLAGYAIGDIAATLAKLMVA
ncbi:hypothetical protein QWY75_04490 [Pontixanthobacter aestiaquae]|nr:hypothetical protein [Pontixanthobacter aestiaquae]MDN3645467.1 hypothetical protein [Pontixanthobacter aestiaquae]